MSHSYHSMPVSATSLSTSELSLDLLDTDIAQLLIRVSMALALYGSKSLEDSAPALDGRAKK